MGFYYLPAVCLEKAEAIGEDRGGAARRSQNCTEAASYNEKREWPKHSIIAKKLARAGKYKALSPPMRRGLEREGLGQVEGKHIKDFFQQCGCSTER